MTQNYFTIIFKIIRGAKTPHSSKLIPQYTNKRIISIIPNTHVRN